MPTFARAGTELFYDVTPGARERPAVLLLNGIFMRTERWDALVPHLEGFTVVRYDMRGQGRSSSPPGVYAPEVHAADLAALVAHLGLRRYHLVGLSNGGVVAAMHAIARPQGLDRLVLACTTAHLDVALTAKLASWRAAVARGGVRHRLEVSAAWGYGRTFLETHPEILTAEVLAGAVAAAPSEAAHIALLDGLLGMPDLRPRLARIAVPTCVVAGDEDLLFPLPYARELAGGIPDARLVTLAGLGHSAPIEDPRAFAAAVRPFLVAADA